MNLVSELGLQQPLCCLLFQFLSSVSKKSILLGSQKLIGPNWPGRKGTISASLVSLFLWLLSLIISSTSNDYHYYHCNLSLQMILKMEGGGEEGRHCNLDLFFDLNITTGSSTTNICR